jgi:NitT/TauT family transport system substrate-binding protein
MNRFAFTAALASATAAGTRRAAAQEPPVLHVAATANDSYASAYFAQDLGFFQRAGLNVELQTLNNGAAVSAAVVGGAVDIGVSTPVQLANAYVHGFPFVIVAPGALSTKQAPAAVVAVAHDSPIRSAKDLEGKTVAVNALKTGSELALDAWLTAGGVDIAKVKVIETVFSDMGPMLQRGTIAAGLENEPAQTLAIRQNGIQIIADPMAAIAPRFLISAWFSTTSFVRRNPDTIRRFTQAIVAANVYANDHQSETAPIIAKYAKWTSISSAR